MLHTSQPPSSCKNSAVQHKRMLKMPEAALFLQDFCSAPFVASLAVDSGLRAFARTPEREHQLLKSIAERPDSILTLAYTQEGTIAGQVSLVPADDWWQGLEGTYEIAIEVSAGWRQRGIARQLLNFVFELDCLEDLIIIGMGLSWHWDMKGLQLTPFAYRSMIEQLFAHYGFTEYLTAEENIRMDPANIFLARLGRRVDIKALSRFYDRLLQSDTLPGM
jgi:acetoin utilization protein AcuA